MAKSSLFFVPDRFWMEVFPTFLLLQHLRWPKSLPPRNLLLIWKLSDSAVESIDLVPFFAVILPVHHRPSPSWSGIVLIEVQCYSICKIKPLLRHLTNVTKGWDLSLMYSFWRKQFVYFKRDYYEPLLIINVMESEILFFFKRRWQKGYRSSSNIVLFV